MLTNASVVGYTTPMPTVSRATLAALALIVLLTACGSDDDDAGGPAVSSSSRHLRAESIVIEGIRYRCIVYDAAGLWCEQKRQ